MRIKILLLSVILSALLIAAAAWVFLRSKSSKLLQTTEVNAAEILPHLQDGDIICRLGGRGVSSFIRHLSAADKRFSHIGIVRIRDEIVSVINAECLIEKRSESVNEVSLPDFLEASKAVGVYRANFMDGAVISDNAVKYLGKPFDWDFDFNDETKIYCTELLYVILKHNAPEHSLPSVTVSGINLKLITPEAVSKSKDFYEVFSANRI